MTQLPIQEMRRHFGDRLQEQEPLSRYTTARVGGPADAFLSASSAQELAEIAAALWRLGLDFTVLGGASNVLISDAGVRGVVVLNRARKTFFDEEKLSVWAESGTNFSALARQACQRGLSGLEWAVGLPGTLGGAVVGNAGAYGGDMAGCLMVAEILHRKEIMDLAPDQSPQAALWPLERLEYAYRDSLLKRQPGQAVVLAARLGLQRSDPATALEKAESFSEHRRRTQPPGATMGSMFKNPPGDFAGRLIDAAGLKGLRRGDAEISTLHANFFINKGQASAADVYQLIETAQKAVLQRFGVSLELEVELLGDWQVERTTR